MSRRRSKRKRRGRRHSPRRRSEKKEPHVPPSPEVKQDLWRALRGVYLYYTVLFVAGYLLPALLDSRFFPYRVGAVVGATLSAGSTLLVFTIVHQLLVYEGQAAEDFLASLRASRFSKRLGCWIGGAVGSLFGLIYPVTAWIRPYTGGRTMDSVFGRFFWAPIGAVTAFVIVSTWSYERAAARKQNDAEIARLSSRVWTGGVVVGFGAWLLFAVPGLFPRGRSGVDLSAPHAWVTIVPLFVILIGIGLMFVSAFAKARRAQAVRDGMRSESENLAEPMELFASTHGMRRLDQPAPHILRIVPTGGMRLFAWCAMGMAGLVYALVGAIALMAPHLSDGAEFPLLIITPFFMIGFLFETVPWRFTFDGERNELRYGNIYGRRAIPFEAVEAVQVIDADGWQMNLVVVGQPERRIHLWDHDKESTLWAARTLGELLDVEVMRIEER